MNTGFKGNNVSISSVKILGTDSSPHFEFSMNFVDNDGVVHAQVRHRLPATKENDPDLNKALTGLLEMLRDRVCAFHFTSPGVTIEKEKVASGIGEALRGRANTPDGVGSQG